MLSTNNELIQVIRDLGLLNMWSEVWFLTHVYEKKIG